MPALFLALAAACWQSGSTTMQSWLRLRFDLRILIAIFFFFSLCFAVPAIIYLRLCFHFGFSYSFCFCLSFFFFGGCITSAARWHLHVSSVTAICLHLSLCALLTYPTPSNVTPLRSPLLINHLISCGLRQFRNN